MADLGRRVGRASSLATLVGHLPMTFPTIVSPQNRRAGTGTPNAKNRVWEGLPSAEYLTWGPEPTLALQKPQGSLPYSERTHKHVFEHIHRAEGIPMHLRNCPRRGSNSQPLAPEANALSN